MRCKRPWISLREAQGSLEWYDEFQTNQELLLTILIQGTIYYTASNHWTNMLMSAAEVNRVAEDFGRFQLPLLLLRRPFLGWTHGSWLLINGAVENAIGWDTDNVCEDYWFGYHVSLSGSKSRLRTVF